MKTILILLVIAACGDNTGPHVEIIPPDAALDAAIDAPPDACMREPSADPCCALLPDEDAARACAIVGLEPGACGVAVCWQADCSRVTFNFCAPSGDAGIDGGA